MKTCQHCGATWPDSTQYCKNCGELLPETAQTTPAAPKPPKRQSVYAAAPQPQPKKSSSHTMLIIIVIIAAAAAIIGAMFYLSRKDESYSKQLLEGDRYFRQQEYKKAIAAYDEAIKMRPREPRPVESKARVYFAQDKYDMALRTINRFDKRRRTASMETTCGNVCLAQGKTKRAAKYYRKALNKLPDQIKDTKDETEQKDLLGLYSEIFETVEPTESQITEATELIDEYGDDSMLMGVTNNNALMRRTIVGEMGAITEGGSFVRIGSNTYHLYENKLLKDDANGKTTTVYTHNNADETMGLGNLNYYMGYFYFTYANQYTMAGIRAADVYKIRPDGSGLKKIASSSNSDTTDCELIVYNGRVYFSWYHSALIDNTAKSALVSYDLNGGDKKTLLSMSGESNTAWLFGIDDDHLYMPIVDHITDIDLDDNSTSSISLGNYELNHYGYLSGFTIADGKLYGISNRSSTQETAFSIDLDSHKTKELDQFAASTYFGLFANGDSLYFLGGNFDDDSAYTAPTLEVTNQDGRLLVSSDDCYRVALMNDDEIWVEDEDGDMHYYAMSGDAAADTATDTESSTSDNQKVSLNSKQVGVLVALYWNPDWFKMYIDDEIGMYYTDETEADDSGTVYHSIDSNGDPTGVIYYRYSGDTVTYAYLEPGETVADGYIVTKTVSLNRLIDDYYNTSSKKTEVNGYVSKLKSRD